MCHKAFIQNIRNLFQNIPIKYQIQRLVPHNSKRKEKTIIELLSQNNSTEKRVKRTLREEEKEEEEEEDLHLKKDTVHVEEDFDDGKNTTKDSESPLPLQNYDHAFEYKPVNYVASQ